MAIYHCPSRYHLFICHSVFISKWNKQYCIKIDLLVNLHNIQYLHNLKNKIILNYLLTLTIFYQYQIIHLSTVSFQLIFSISFHTHYFFPCEIIGWHFEEIFLILGNKNKTTYPIFQGNMSIYLNHINICSFSISFILLYGLFLLS